MTKCCKKQSTIYFNLVKIARVGTLPLTDFEGVNSLPLMTIHKSKGLEYHTVIFLGS